ncbi:MAG TPA: DUF2975 domain-containing protein [Jatrophihabitans sp.]|nr:DUF2975 domain-containing protein [Jatrophihabitans sp.]
MTAVRKPIISTAILELLLIVAMTSVAYSQVFVPLKGTGALWPTISGSYGPPSVEVTLDYPAVLQDPQTNPFRFPDLSTTQPLTPGSGLEFLLPTRTRVSISEPDLRQRVGVIGTPVLRGLLAIAVLLLLLLMVRTLRSGDPFVPANARRMYVIAATVGIGGLVADLLGQWGRHGVLDNRRVAPLVVRESYHLSLLPLAIGVAIAVGAEVFRQGIALRADVDGLV